MSNFVDFFAVNIQQPEEVSVKVSKRLPAFKIKPLKEEEMAAIRKAATKRYKNKAGTWETYIDHEAFQLEMVTKSVVIPDFNNAELQEAWEAIGSTNLIRKMLLGGEFGELVNQVYEVSGYLPEEIDELIDEVKNE